MRGTEWAVRVLAYPAAEGAIAQQRDELLNEMRVVMSAAQTELAPSPLTEQYVDLLKTALRSAGDAMATGAWRTAIYLLGDSVSYPRLASVWRSAMSGPKSLPEPVRTADLESADKLADLWALPDTEGGPPPGRYHRPFEYQTLLTTAQLAACLHLPELESAGFTVNIAARFDVVPPVVADHTANNNLTVGRILQDQQLTTGAYRIPLHSLARHSFVTGVTGSGKTNTVFHLLQQIAEVGIPFLVIEPAKTEYRSLIDDPRLGRHLQIFTLGDETVSPFRLNPFEFPPGIPVAVHLDLLRSVFNVSFGMWTPLPQVLENCLHRIYEDRGWDITANRNRRLHADAPRSRAFPTITDLVAKIDEIIGQLGYEDRVTNDLRAALRTRLDSLRTGGKGRMLDVQASLPIELITQRPTVLELEGLGDDDDKAFLMGLLMVRLVEHLRVSGQYAGLRHLLVIEEAHRLLAASGTSAQHQDFQADVRGKAVDTFAHLISEIRAYGQGVVVVDQVPSKLAPDVIKNTNLKVTHRIVAGDDRASMSSAMVMDEHQERALATLRSGQAAVFADGDDAPLLVQVAPAKRSAETIPTAERVRHHMHLSPHLVGMRDLYLPSVECDESCASFPDACAVAQRIVENTAVRTTFGRMVLSAMFDAAAVDRLFSELVSLVDPLRPPWIESTPLFRTLATHASRRFMARRGAQAGWSYRTTDELGAALHHMLIANPDDAVKARSEFQKRACETLGAIRGPFPGCDQIWADTDHPCACRFAVADLIAPGSFDAEWRQASEADATTSGVGRSASWEVCKNAANHLIELPSSDWPSEQQSAATDIARRIAVCFGQQMLARNPYMHPRTKRELVQQLLKQAGFGG
ncbi:ATP-binding protein [Rhodococcus aetherivorans]